MYVPYVILADWRSSAYPWAPLLVIHSVLTGTIINKPVTGHRKVSYIRTHPCKYSVTVFVTYDIASSELTSTRRRSRILIIYGIVFFTLFWNIRQKAALEFKSSASMKASSAWYYPYETLLQRILLKYSFSCVCLTDIGLWYGGLRS